VQSLVVLKVLGKEESLRVHKEERALLLLHRHLTPLALPALIAFTELRIREIVS